MIYLVLLYILNILWIGKCSIFLRHTVYKISHSTNTHEYTHIPENKETLDIIYIYYKTYIYSYRCSVNGWHKYNKLQNGKFSYICRLNLIEILLLINLLKETFSFNLIVYVRVEDITLFAKLVNFIRQLLIS